MSEATKETRCLLCSLGCRCKVELANTGWQTVAPDEGPGVCARAFAMGELISHPERANLSALRQNGRMRTASAGDALGEFAERFSEGSPTALIVDGNYPKEAIAAMLKFARTAPDTTAAVYVPGNDRAMLAGLEKGKWKKGARPTAENDVVLVAGDAFASHPPVARSVLDARFAAKRNKLLVVSPFEGRTAGHATRAFVVPPGGEAELLAGVAKELGAGLTGVNTGAVSAEAAEIAKALSQAKAPAMVLAQPEGTTSNAHIAAYAAAGIAAKLKMPLLPLLTYGNAMGAVKAAEENDASPLPRVVADAMAGRFKTVCFVGGDPSTIMPGTAEKIMEAAEFVAVAAPFGIEAGADVDVLIPLGMGCEEDGCVVLPADGEISFAPADTPPAGAFSMTRLASELSERTPASEPKKQAGESVNPSWDLSSFSENGTKILIGTVDAMGFADGALSSRAGWARNVQPEPTVTMNPADCREAGTPAGSTVEVKTEAGEAALKVECEASLPPGVVAVPMSFKQTRGLFRWNAEADAVAISCGPMEVTIRGSD